LEVSFGTGLPKMSETLVAFAEPLLAEVPQTEPGWRTGLYAAATVWNGLVSGVAEAEIATQLQRGLGPSVDVPGLVRCLAERKEPEPRKNKWDWVEPAVDRRRELAAPGRPDWQQT
jgi:hypothetical protein